MKMNNVLEKHAKVPFTAKGHIFTIPIYKSRETAFIFVLDNILIIF